MDPMQIKITGANASAKIKCRIVSRELRLTMYKIPPKLNELKIGPPMNNGKYTQNMKSASKSPCTGDEDIASSNRKKLMMKPVR